MYQVGITGNIGSGKSTVCKIFEGLKIPVYYADERAKWLMVNNPKLKDDIINLLGQKAYLPDGTLNKPFVSSRIFNNDELLDALNALVHPAVFKDADAWHQRQNAPFTLEESALIIESFRFEDVDFVILVTAPLEVRIDRVMNRDGKTRKDVLAIESNQFDEELKVDIVDFVIVNDGVQDLRRQVIAIYNKLLSRTTKQLSPSV